jgi:hypothetical protein
MRYMPTTWNCWEAAGAKALRIIAARIIITIHIMVLPTTVGIRLLLWQEEMMICHSDKHSYEIQVI